MFLVWWRPGTNRSQNGEVVWVYPARVTETAESLQTLAAEAEESACFSSIPPDLGI